MEDPLSSYMKIQEMVRNEARQIAEQVYNDLGTRYNVATVPTHSHNGVDSVQIAPSGVLGFMAVPTQPNATGATGGVLSAINLGGQQVTQGPNDSNYTTQNTVPQPNITVFPVPIIYGNGVGVDSAFNGGAAPNGTMIFFENGLTLSALWIKTENGWYGISPDLTA